MSAKNIIHNVDQKDLMKLAIGWYCDQIGCNVFEFIGDEEGDIASPVEDVVSQVLSDIDDIRQFYDRSIVYKDFSFQFAKIKS